MFDWGGCPAATNCSSSTTMRVLEFYSGIGGLRYSLEMSGVKAVVVEAFDINEIANDVYEHNFGHRPSQGNIQGLNVKQLDGYKADAWLLSPPCQPYTRQGLQKDVDDARATSFLTLLQYLRLMVSPPTHVLVENVVGFENSVTHRHLLAALEIAGFVTQEFILTPLQFGIPYSRPRYFCLAKLISHNFVQPDYNGQLLCIPGPLLQYMGTVSQSVVLGQNKDCKIVSGSYTRDRKVDSGQGRPTPIQLRRNEPLLDPTLQCGLVRDYLETSPAQEEAKDSQVAGTVCIGVSPDGKVSLGRDSDCIAENAIKSWQGASDEPKSSGISQEDQWEPYKVPLNVIQRWIDASDIVTPQSRRCCCFTRSYTRFAKGTGSFLATKVSLNLEKAENVLEKHIFDLRLEGQSLASLGLRYFTPREIANLHSFPEEFRFPVHVRLKQRYALLGNSLSVAVVSSLLKYLFSTSVSQKPSIET